MNTMMTDQTSVLTIVIGAHGTATANVNTGELVFKVVPGNELSIIYLADRVRYELAVGEYRDDRDIRKLKHLRVSSTDPSCGKRVILHTNTLAFLKRLTVFGWRGALTTKLTKGVEVVDHPALEKATLFIYPAIGGYENLVPGESLDLDRIQWHDPDEVERVSEGRSGNLTITNLARTLLGKGMLCHVPDLGYEDIDRAPRRTGFETWHDR